MAEIRHLVTIATLWGNAYSSLNEILRVNGQRLWDHATKFARWQHPALGREARFYVPGTIVFRLISCYRVAVCFWTYYVRLTRCILSHHRRILGLLSDATYWFLDRCFVVFRRSMCLTSQRLHYHQDKEARPALSLRCHYYAAFRAGARITNCTSVLPSVYLSVRPAVVA